MIPAWFKPFARRIRLMTARAVAHLINDAPDLQLLQLKVLADETRDEVERFQNYGFTSCPLSGAEAVVVSIGSNRSHLVAVAVDDRNNRKKNLQSGEVAMYTDEGDYILMKRGQIIEVVAGSELQVTAPLVNVNASSKVTLNTPQCDITGNLNVTGNIVAAAVGAGGIDLATHVHPGDSGGTTGQPQ